MTQRRWEFVVHDARARRRRGTVAWCDRLPSPLSTLRRPHEFSIVLLSSPANVRSAGRTTAICVPGTPKIHSVGTLAPQHLPAKVEELTMPPQRMAEYAAGRIVMEATSLIAPEAVFPPHSDHPRLDRLALALLESADAERLAPYTGLIRHELDLPPGTDPLIAVEARISPVDPRQRPPARAPGVIRLTKALRRLRAGQPPEPPLELLAEDLRFLRLFEEAERPLPPDALDRLLADVTNEPAPRRGRRPRTPRVDAGARKIVPLRPPRTGSEPGEDA